MIDEDVYGNVMIEHGEQVSKVQELECRDIK